jgi:hypothetical protein
MPLNKYEDADIETSCGGCKLRNTKPEWISDDLIDHVGTAAELDRIHRIGGRFTYPDGLTAHEWVCLSGLDQGRGEADKLKRQRDARKPNNGRS